MLYNPIEYAFSINSDDVCIDINDYIQTAIPVELIKDSNIIVLHSGLFSEYKLLNYFPDIFSRIEIKKPHENLQERFFLLGQNFIISNIIGYTRLIHNLVLLRLYGISKERIRIISEQIDFSKEYENALKSIIIDQIVQKVVFSFNSKMLLDAMIDKFKITPEIRFWSGSLLQSIWIKREKILLVHLTTVYGDQIVPLLEVLTKKFFLQKVLFFGACGAVKNSVGLHDTVVVRTIMDNSGKRILDGNILNSIITEYPLGLTENNHSHIEDVTSVLCIPAESRLELNRISNIGLGITDLELLPMANFLSNHLSIDWGAVLHVSDRPLIGKEQLGTITTLENRDRSRKNEIMNQAKIILNC